jgi:hypothetical protein
MQQESMRVILGRSHLSAFVTAPKAVQVLGIVRLGMEFGLLALDRAGSYVRVNGSQFVTLDLDLVERAIRNAAVDTRETVPGLPPIVCPRPAPTVVVRKTRRVLCGPSRAAALTG